MFETFGNKKGIMDLVTNNWPEDQKKRARKETEQYRPVIDDDAEVYIPKSER